LFCTDVNQLCEAVVKQNGRSDGSTDGDVSATPEAIQAAHKQTHQVHNESRCSPARIGSKMGAHCPRVVADAAPTHKELQELSMESVPIHSMEDGQFRFSSSAGEGEVCGGPLGGSDPTVANNLPVVQQPWGTAACSSQARSVSADSDVGPQNPFSQLGSQPGSITPLETLSGLRPQAFDAGPMLRDTTHNAPQPVQDVKMEVCQPKAANQGSVTPGELQPFLFRMQ
jgi:hypothetical protein